MRRHQQEQVSASVAEAAAVAEAGNVSSNSRRNGSAAAAAAAAAATNVVIVGHRRSSSSSLVTLTCPSPPPCPSSNLVMEPACSQEADEERSRANQVGRRRALFTSALGLHQHLQARRCDHTTPPRVWALRPRRPWPLSRPALGLHQTPAALFCAAAKAGVVPSSVVALSTSALALHQHLQRVGMTFLHRCFESGRCAVTGPGLVLGLRQHLGVGFSQLL